MTDFPASTTPSTQVARPVPTGAALVVYALFAVAAVIGVASHGFPLFAPLFGLVGLIAIVIAYVKRGEAAGTWLASHFRWLIRTFWWSLLWDAIGILLLMVTLFLAYPIAWVIWVATAIWVIYRVVRGFLLFNDRRPIPSV